jgi:hypothetical protein
LWRNSCDLLFKFILVDDDELARRTKPRRLTQGDQPEPFQMDDQSELPEIGQPLTF